MSSVEQFADTSGDQLTSATDGRLLQELLKVTSASLVPGAFGAPILAAVIATAFCLIDTLGNIPVWNGVIFVLVILGWTAGATLMIRVFGTAERSEASLKRWFGVFIVNFVLNGAAWGSAALLLWAPDLPLNHFALMVLCLLSIGNGGNEHGESLAFVVAIMIGQASVTGLSFIIHDSDIAMAAAVLIPVGMVWFSFIAFNSRARFRELVRTRLKNEDLARSFEAARDSALALKAKAESASLAKSAFLANMSHELRTPLNAIIGFAQIVRDELFGPLNNARYKDYLGDIEGSGQHLLGIINDILDIAKIEAGKIELVRDWIDPQRFIEDAVKVSGGEAPETAITIKTVFAHDHRVIYGDGRMLRQSVINLLSNAIKHTPDGQVVHVATSLTPDGHVRISVIDPGPGVPAHLVERVFNAFEQADNSYAREKQGTGLGLALVRAFVTAHDGRVWLESEPGRGTSAIIELPAAAPGAESIAA